MFNNVVLDIFIGLIFIFLLYSLLATIIQEILARWFNLRARILQKAIRRMLEDGDAPDPGWKNLAVIRGAQNLWEMFLRFFAPIKKKEAFLKKFYTHPSIKYLGEDRLFSKPSYLHAHNFSQTVLHLLRGNQYNGKDQNESALIAAALEDNSANQWIRPETLSHLKMLFYDSHQDAYVFRQKLEDWFEETMERSTGWYKKQTQTFLVIIGFIIAWTFNVDTIAITKILSKDKNVREQLVQMAINRKDKYGQMVDSSRTETIKKINKGDTVETITTYKYAASDSVLNQTYQDLNNDAKMVENLLGLKGQPSPFYKDHCSQLAHFYDTLLVIEKNDTIRTKITETREVLLKKCESLNTLTNPYQDKNLRIFGWLLTALAISLGAPFWFDLLNRFIKLRESGPKPDGNTAAPNSTASTSQRPANNIIKG